MIASAPCALPLSLSVLCWKVEILMVGVQRRSVGGRLARQSGAPNPRCDGQNGGCTTANQAIAASWIAIINTVNKVPVTGRLRSWRERSGRSVPPSLPFEGHGYCCGVSQQATCRERRREGWFLQH